MKTFKYSLLAAALACGLANAQTAYTTPVGYTTVALPASQATYMSVNLHNPIVTSGILTGSTISSVTDSTADFTTDLVVGKTYVLELKNGTAEGVVQKITSFTGTELTTEDDISTFVVDNVTEYNLREAATVASIFGANNEAGLTATATGDPGTFDEILTINALGSFNTYFYYDDGVDTGWFDLDFNAVATAPLIYTDGLYVRRLAGSTINLVVSGEVKVVDTQYAILPGNTFAGSSNPVGSTLGNSGLSAFVTADNDGDPPYADQVLIQQANGAYLTYFYYDDGVDQGWFDSSFNDGNNVDISNGFIIQSSTASPKPAKVSLPYPSL